MLKTLAVLLLTLPALSQTSNQPAPSAKPADLRIAAAADMQPVLEILGPIYEKKANVHLVISYASSSVLATQVIARGPFDLFMGADFYFPEKVVAANMADTGSPIAYAKGTLVLWTRKDSQFNPLHLNALESANLKTLAIADPDHAPYGRAAEQALKKMDFYPKVEKKLVKAENVSQSGQFALTGNAQLALISKTLAVSPKFKNSGTFVLFPFSTYTPINQTAVVLRNSPVRDAAHAFLNWFLSFDVQNKLPELGLSAVK